MSEQNKSNKSNERNEKNENQITENKYITDIFVEGARKGWNIGIYSMIPNILMAFVIIQLLRITGLLDVIGVVFQPLMGLWGLPGETALVLIAAIMSMGGAAGVAASLFSDSLISVTDIAVMVPSIYLSGSLIQYLGRVLGVIGFAPKEIGVLFLITFINSLAALTVMSIII